MEIVTDSSSDNSTDSEEHQIFYSYESLSSSENLFLSTTGMKLQCFNNSFFPACEPIITSKRKKMGRKNVLSCIDEAVMILVFLRKGGTYKDVGIKFGISESRIRIIIRDDIFAIAQLYENCIEWMNLGSQERHLSEEELVGFSSCVGIIDATEIKINRPKKNNLQRKFYSGKKKQHCVKFQIIVQPLNGQIISLGRLHKGKDHDFKLFKNSGIYDVVGNEESLMGDSGYQGMDNYCNAIIPKKKPRRNRLSQEDATRNEIISRRRVIVEHVFAKMKKFRILGNKWIGKVTNQQLLEKIIFIVGIIVNINNPDN